MKIAVNLTGTCRKERSGCAWFAIRVVDALLNLNDKRAVPDEYSFFCRLSRWRRRELCYRPRNMPLRWFQEPFWPIVTPFDVAHGFGTHPPNWRGPAIVATLFDVFSMIDGNSGWSSQEFRKTKEKYYKDMANRCDFIITSSENTRNDFLKFFDYPPERIRCIPGGVSNEFSPERKAELPNLAARLKISGPYALFVGASSERKNVDRLVEAFKRSKAYRSLKLVIAGGIDQKRRAMIARLESEGCLDRFIFTGYVPDSDLPALFAGASAFLFPTLYEGFGMPVLEAMASGVPVLAGNSGSVPEVAGNHAVLVDPLDVDAIASGIDRVLEMPPNRIEAARKHASAFTWERHAQLTREVYEWAASNRK